GPFVVNTVPIVEGAGRATVVTTDALGRETSRSLSFYVASNLLQRGLFTYSAAAGVARRTFGLSSWSYRGPAASGSFRYGLTNFLTVAGHAEVGERIASGGAGADLRLHTFGVLGGSLATGGHAGSSGLQYSASYSYARPRFSVMLQRLERQREFADLSEYGQSIGDPLTGRLARRVDQVTAAAAPPFVGGTIGLGYFSVDGDESGRQRLVNLSYSRRFVLGTSVYLSATQALGQGRRPTVRFQVVRPLGRQGNLTATSASPGGAESVRLQYSRSAPLAGGLGWTAGVSPTREGHQQADVTWRTPYAQVQGGFYGKPASLTRWAGLSGSVVILGREIAATNRVDDAFVVVDAAGHQGVPVLFENQVVGRTNGRGRLMVPGVSAYYASKFSIDPLALPSGVTVDVVEQRAAVRPRSGAVIRFSLASNLSALVTLVDTEGRPLPLGLPVTHVGNGQQGIVGWDGLTYFDRLQPRNILRVDLPNGQSCAVIFVLDPDSSETARIGPLTCQPAVEP
ncbi:MAG: fimbria/pilus outer membrane usher protein, partial [Vicinamibacterales bacterium]